MKFEEYQNISFLQRNFQTVQVTSLYLSIEHDLRTVRAFSSAPTKTVPTSSLNKMIQKYKIGQKIKLPVHGCSDEGQCSTG